MRVRALVLPSDLTATAVSVLLFIALVGSLEGSDRA